MDLKVIHFSICVKLMLEKLKKSQYPHKKSRQEQNNIKKEVVLYRHKSWMLERNVSTKKKQLANYKRDLLWNESVKKFSYK